MSETLETRSVSRWLSDHISLFGLSNPKTAAYLSVRELLENSLDSCESAAIFPEIKIELKQTDDEWKETMTDNGTGIPKESVPKAFGVVLTSSKYVNRQTRGFLGAGGHSVISFAYDTTKKPFIILSATKMSRTYWTFKLGVDVNKNEPIIFEQSEKPNSNWNGTIVQITSRADFESALGDIKKYLRLTHMLCPYATISLKVNDKLLLNFEKTVNVMPPIPSKIDYHPHGVSTTIIDDLKHNNEPLKGFLIHNFQRIGETTANNFLKFSGFDGSRMIGDLKNEEIANLVSKMKKFDDWLPPDTSGLSPVGEAILTNGMNNDLAPEYVSYSSRKGVYEGFGFIVEVCTGYGGKIPPAENFNFILYRYANKIPLLTSEGSCIMTKCVNEQDYRHYGIEGNTPLAFAIHCLSTKLPHKTLGKEFLADVPELRREIDLTIKETLRQVKYFVSHAAKASYQKQRQNIFNTYAGPIANEFAKITGEDKAKIETDLKKALGI